MRRFKTQSVGNDICIPFICFFIDKNLLALLRSQGAEIFITLEVHAIQKTLLKKYV